MHDSEEYDAIVVGGGPAGSTAGYLLSRLGLAVTVLDRSHFPRPKLCGGLITHKTFRLLHRVFGETLGSLKEKGILECESDHYEVYRKKQLVAAHSVQVPFYFVDRLRYDDFLLRKAEEAGAEIAEGDAARALDLKRRQITTMKGRVLRAKFVIGADGVNSVIRRSLPSDRFDKSSWQSGLATAFESYVSQADPKAPSRSSIDHPAIVFDFVNWGYCWIFPNSSRLVVGMGGLNKANRGRFRSSFRDFASAFDLSGRLGEIGAHPVPYGNFLSTPAYQDVLLAGDAAGFVDPITGEGIFYAQRSAELAARAIRQTISDGGTSEDAYVRLLSKHVYPELTYAKMVRWWIFEVSARLRHHPTATLLDLFGDRCIEVIHGIRSYRWLRMSEVDHD